MPRKSVHSLNIRDFTYILANLREDDREELGALLPHMTPFAEYPKMMAEAAFSGPAYSIYLDDAPVAAFGTNMGGSYATAVIWAFGTKLFRRAVPTMQHFTWNKISHDLYNAGILRLECRALSSNTFVRNWLKRAGFHEECPLPYYGTGGQSFHQYVLTVEDYNSKFGRRLN